MKVQIFEQFFGGHHTTYIEALLPALTELQKSGNIDRIVVTITLEHLNSPAFQQQLSKFIDRVEFEPSLPYVYHEVTTRDRYKIAQNLVSSAQRLQPDYLIATSADQESLFLALRARFGLPTLPKQTQAIGIIHAGLPGLAARRTEIMKDRAYRFAWQYAPWSCLQPVNPIVYEWIQRQGGMLAQRTRMLPDPVFQGKPFTKTAARAQLNLPVEGRYVGYVGMMDRRKAIPELLAAFRAAATAPTDRLLLVGTLLPSYKALIQDQYADLIVSNRLIMLDRYLTRDEVAAGFQALDVAAVVHYPRPALSANLLKAIAFDRPVIVDSFGYTGMIVERFGLGQSCNVYDHAALVATLRRGLEASASYRRNPKTQRLLEFHQPENFANVALHDLYVRTMPDRLPPMKTWEWVNAAQPQLDLVV